MTGFFRRRSAPDRVAIVAAALVLLVIVAYVLARSAGPGAASRGPEVSPPTTVRELPTAASTSPLPSAECEPTDQDAYVYHPDRFRVLAACIEVTGTVEAVRVEQDGDLHILLAIDPVYRELLRPANEGVELGDLVVEPICVGPVSQESAIDACAADPNPLADPFPHVGDHVWMEGRYVLDLEHDGWAELHPLYRWGLTTSEE